MFDRFNQFCEAVQSAMTVTLATVSGNRITMRVVSPVCYREIPSPHEMSATTDCQIDRCPTDASEVERKMIWKGYKILIFTARDSKKYQQLLANPTCCLATGFFFAEATAEFCGATMLPKNQKLRDAYTAKYPGAFDENVEFGGRDAEFLLLTPVRLTGWAFENDRPTETGIPTIPFEISLNDGT